MIAIALDPAAAQVAVAGHGAPAHRRFDALRAGGAESARLFLAPDLPGHADFATLSALWIVGLNDTTTEYLAAHARAARVLVNVEDRPNLCDFHSVAEIRRGDLLLTVSTSGASPGLAARIRARLAAQFGPEWADRLAHVRRARATWRRDGLNVTDQIDSLLQAKGWLS